MKNALGKTLVNFDKAPIRLTGISLMESYSTKSNLMAILLDRYKSVTA